MISLLFFLKPVLSQITFASITTFCAFPDLSFNGTLVTNYNTTYSPSRVDYYGFTGYTYFGDAAVNLAIEDVNNDPSLLPNITLGIKRFTDCGQWYPGVDSDYNGGMQGLVATQVVQDVMENSDVIAVIGSEYSSTVVISGQELSLLQIPYCSTISGSPRFSDKNKYPYFFRTFSASGYGNITYQLLKSWKVGRVALIIEKSDEVGLAAGNDILRVLQKNGVLILLDLRLPSHMDYNLFDSTSIALQNSDARYVIVSGQPVFTSAVAYYLGKRGLASSNHVWIGISQPSPFGDPIQVYGPDFYEVIQGFIYTSSLPPDSSNPIFTHVLNEFNRRIGADMSEIDFAFGFQLQYFYDCVMLMAHGITKLMKSNPDFTPQMLMNRDLNQYMNYTLFQNVGYNGVSTNDTRLSDTGDLLLPFQFFSYSGDYYNMSAFGQTNSEDISFTFYENSPPLFYGGSSIPPRDGSHLEHLFYSHVLIVTWAGLGIAFSIGLLVTIFIFKNHKIIKATSVPESILQCLGSIILYTSIIFYVSEASVSSCRIRQWLFFIGYNLIIVPMIMKNLFLAFILRQHIRSSRVHRILHIFRGMHAVLILVIVFTLLDWTLKTPIAVNPISSTQYIYLKCVAKSGIMLPQVFTMAITIFLLPTLYFTANIRRAAFDESAIVLFCIVAISLVFLLVHSFDQTDLFADLKQIVYILIALSLFLIISVCTRIQMALTDLASSKLLSRNSQVNSKPWRNSTLQRASKVATPKRSLIRNFVLNSVVASCPCRWNTLLGWKQVVPEVNQIEFTLWLSIMNFDDIHCFRILRDTNISVFGSLVLIKIETNEKPQIVQRESSIISQQTSVSEQASLIRLVSKPIRKTRTRNMRYHVEFEFENAEIASKFRKELVDTIQNALFKT